MKEERNYGLDLLKVVSILMIILLHYNNVKMGGLLGNVEPNTFPYFVSHFTESLCIMACNLFVMISGYYLCQSHKIKVRKIVDIVLLLVFYGIGIYALSLLFGLTTFNLSSIKYFFQTIDNRWFINIYLLLYILHPFLNKIIEGVDEKKLKFLILICLVCFSLLPSLVPFSEYINLRQFIKDGGYGITNFILLYFIGAYIRLYKDKIKLNKFLLFLGYLLLSFFTTLVSQKYGEAFHYNFLFNIVNTILLFFIFKNIKIKRGNYISAIANTSLAVYIIHENLFITKYFYREIFKTPLYYHSAFLIPHMLFTILCLFMFCVGIEFLRKALFKVSIDKWIKKSKILNKTIEI